MKQYQLPKELESIVRNNVRFDETAPWTYVLYQDKHLAHGETALLNKFEKIKKFAEKNNGYCKVVKELAIVGDNKQLHLEMNCDTVAAKAFDAVVEYSGKTQFYLTLRADQVWTADVPRGQVDVKAVRFCEEKDYPVDLYYARTDINGSSSVEKETCNNRYELIKTLNWLGECGFAPLKLWDFNIETTRNDRVTEIFDAGAKARAKKLELSLDEKIADAKAMGKKEYSLVLCKGEPEEETVKALLTDQEVDLIKKDLSGELNTGINIELVDGREIEIGIIDEIAIPEREIALDRQER